MPDVTPKWIKSSLSFSNGNCVEVTDLPAGAVGVRHSKDTEGPVLRFTPDEWRAAWHELRCRECRVTWVSWWRRLTGDGRGYTP